MKTLISLLFIILATASTHGQSQWTLRRPLPTPNSLLGVTYGAGRFVAVGLNDTVISSPDAVTWTSWQPKAQRERTRVGYGSVAYGKGRFVAVGGDSDSRKALTSTDGIIWEEHELRNGFNPGRVIFANDLFISFGRPEGDEAAHAIATSPDGLTWTERWSAGTNRYVFDIIPLRHAVGHGTVVVSSRAESQEVTESHGFLSSTNGTSWNYTPVGQTGFGESVPRLIAYGNGTFLALADAWRNDRAETDAFISADGFTWEKSATLKTASPLSPLGFAGGKFVCLAFGSLREGIQEGVVRLTSTDGRTWDEVPTTGIPGLWTLSVLSWAHAPGVIVLAGQPEVSDLIPNGFARVMTSPDGIHWTKRVGATTYSLNGAAGESGLVAIAGGDVGGTLVLTSTNGRDWEENRSLAGSGYSVAAGQGMFVAVGSSGTFTSKDGKTWTPQAGAAHPYGEVRYSGGRFIVLSGVDAAAPYPRVSLSSDGTVWTTSVVTNATHLRDVASDGAQVIAIGNGPFNSLLFRSVDGTNWTPRILGLPWAPTQLAYGNGRFVAMDRSEQKLGTLISTNGIDWTVHPRPEEFLVLAGLIFAKGRFYVAEVFSGGRVFSSPDGLTWTTHRTGYYQRIEKLTVSSTMGLFAFGPGEVILHSPWDWMVGMSRAPAGGAVNLQINGPPGQSFTLEATAGFAPAVWEPISTNALTTNPLRVTDPDAAKFPRRFYRTVTR